MIFSDYHVFFIVRFRSYHRITAYQFYWIRGLKLYNDIWVDEHICFEFIVCVAVFSWRLDHFNLVNMFWSNENRFWQKNAWKCSHFKIGFPMIKNHFFYLNSLNQISRRSLFESVAVSLDYGRMSCYDRVYKDTRMLRVKLIFWLWTSPLRNLIINIHILQFCTFVIVKWLF